MQSSKTNNNGESSSLEAHRLFHQPCFPNPQPALILDDVKYKKNANSKL